MIRNYEQATIDIFLVTAVTTVLLLRLYLAATGYPQIGGGGLHIAHVLWGGLGMVLAIGILLSFLLPSTRRLAAFLGGIGFGAFIDELGKFLTSDNNYFFKPTAALVYTIFVALYFAARQVRGNLRNLTPDERLVNAIEISKDLALGRLSPSERRRALQLLAGADAGNPLVAALTAQFATAHPERTHPTSLQRIARKVQDRYAAVVRNRWFRRVIAGLFVLQAIATIMTLLYVAVVAGGAALGITEAQAELRAAQQGGLSAIIEGASSILVGIFTIVGVARLWRRDPAHQSRIHAYQAFEIAILIDLLLFQPFSLLNDSFAGFAGVIIDLALLGTLRFMIVQERHIAAAKPAPALAPHPSLEPTRLVPTSAS